MSENIWSLVNTRIIHNIEKNIASSRHKIVSWDKDSIKIGDLDKEKFLNDPNYLPDYSYNIMIGMEMNVGYSSESADSKFL